MAYLVLARKYRPATFSELVGQDHVVRTLSNAMAMNRLHHAFLFTGARGVGKTTTARVLARAINCEKGVSPAPCGECSQCKEIASGSSPDILEIDGASNTGVDNVRELRETVRYLPSKCRTKIYIIDEVHMLSQAAFNALLKTLEEPPPHVKFIFATTEPQKIPATILSRCQRFDFRRVASAVLVKHLQGILEKEGIQLSSSALSSIVRQADGSVRDALSLLDQVISYVGTQPRDTEVNEALGLVDRGAISQLVDAVAERNANRLLATIGELDNRGVDLSDAAQLVTEHLRDLTVLKMLEGADDIDKHLHHRTKDDLALLQNQAQKFSRPDLHRLFQLAVVAAMDTARSMHPRTTLEMGLLRLLEVEPTQSLDTLLTRIDALVSGYVPTLHASAPSKAQTASSEKVVAAAPVQKVEDGHQGWQRFVDNVRAQKPSIASVLEHGRPMRFDPTAVEIGYVTGTFYWDSARETATKKIIDEYLTRHFGHAVVSKIVPVSEQTTAAASLAQTDEKTQKEREEQIRHGALNHPVVRGAIEILGGEVKQVIPLNTPSDEN